MPVPSSRHQGFTLIEIMVVVTIIGILSAMIVVNAVTSDPQKDLDREARRLKAVIELAEEEALFGQVDIGIIVKESSYAFARYELPPNNTATTQPASPTATNTQSNVSPQWTMIEDETEFRQYELSEDYEIILEVEDDEIDPSGLGNTNNSTGPLTRPSSKITEDEDAIVPAIYISPGGEITPFVMEIYIKEDNNLMVKISGDEFGRIWIGDEEEI
ncbi:MAG: type II secretion system minor pseudopilin GspH [Gammaproteobacteria bacterium]|nr:type II secretion system minor pseudopilin GspH [Gammaproteobacteria bacterium]